MKVHSVSGCDRCLRCAFNRIKMSITSPNHEPCHECTVQAQSSDLQPTV